MFCSNASIRLSLNSLASVRSKYIEFAFIREQYLTSINRWRAYLFPSVVQAFLLIKICDTRCSSSHSCVVLGLLNFNSNLCWWYFGIHFIVLGALCVLNFPSFQKPLKRCNMLRILNRLFSINCSIFASDLPWSYKSRIIFLWYRYRYLFLFRCHFKKSFIIL